jgi:branched-chain amino acid transport system ATP-binding protein
MSTVLRVSNLSKEFGGLRAVDDFSLEVAAGEFVGLIGPNGCGKTTTFNCISGLLEATGGSVEVFGQPAGRLRPDQIQQLGLTRTFQHTRLWREMTAIENLLIPPRNQFGLDPLRALLTPWRREEERARVRRAYEVLDQLQIRHMAHNLTSELSGGQSR